MVKIPKILPIKNKYYQILDYESRLGAKIFGLVPEGHSRQFFCFDPHTWVWHEEWKDENNQEHVQTTFYHLRNQQVYKSYGDQVYHPLDDQERQNFLQAAQIYCQTIPEKISKLSI